MRRYIDADALTGMEVWEIVSPILREYRNEIEIRNQFFDWEKWASVWVILFLALKKWDEQITGEES